MRLLIGWALAHALFACNAGGKVLESRNAKSEAPPSSATVDTAVIEAEEEESYFETQTIANEPVSVGGAFLTCRYNAAKPQGSASYQMDCDVGPLNEVKSTIVKANFFKLDAKGLRTNLAVLNEDLAGLKWTLQESSSTLAYDRVEVVLSANGSAAASLTTTISSPLILTAVTSFWLGGEPNNTLIGNPEGEDCVEFGNLATKIDHQFRTGLVAGTYGRMNDLGCAARSSNFLCRKLDSSSDAAKWVLSIFSGTFLESLGACPLGYAFSFPFDEVEVTEVSRLIDDNPAIQNIWVNINDRTEEGKFAVFFR